MWRLLAILLCVYPAASLPGEFGIGLGQIGFENARIATVSLDIRRDAAFRRGRTTLRYGAAVETDTDRDVWIGAGVVARRPFARRWQVEAAFMPGLYARGRGPDLGGPVQFRTQVGIARRIGPGLWLGLSASHKSNGGLKAHNPGENMLALTILRRF